MSMTAIKFRTCNGDFSQSEPSQKSNPVFDPETSAFALPGTAETGL